METKVYHNKIKVIRIDTNSGRSFVFKTVKDSEGNPRVLYKEYLAVENGTSVPHYVLAQDPTIVGRGTIEEITIMDDQDMDYIHYNNAAKPQEIQLPLFPNPVTTGLQSE